MSDLFTRTSAVFSKDRKYRYTLTRVWGDGPMLNFIMLNPSIADENDNDPTVERCQRRAVAMGFGSLCVTNIFALVSTDPAGLRCDDPVGPDNDKALRDMAKAAGMVVCAWGVHGRYLNRSLWVEAMLRGEGVALHHLGMTKSPRKSQPRQPRHPLYIPYSQQPIEWKL